MGIGGDGYFRKILKGINIKTKMEVGIQYERVDTRHPHNIYEGKLIKYLLKEPSVIDKGISNVYYCATEANIIQWLWSSQAPLYKIYSIYVAESFHLSQYQFQLIK